MAENIIGQTFNMLTVIRRAPSRRGKTVWECICSCGAIKEIRANSLLRGKTKSCGCLHHANHGGTKPTHGHTVNNSATKTYTAWLNMKGRCDNPQDNRWYRYGGRGITVAPEMRSFEGFLKVIGECPPGLTLDRIDNNGNYEAGNVRWVDRTTQMRNMSTTRWITFQGRTLSMAEWSDITGIGYTTIKQRLKYGWPAERALTEPVH